MSYLLRIASKLGTSSALLPAISSRERQRASKFLGAPYFKVLRLSHLMVLKRTLSKLTSILSVTIYWQKSWVLVLPWPDGGLFVTPLNVGGLSDSVPIMTFEDWSADIAYISISFGTKLKHTAVQSPNGDPAKPQILVVTNPPSLCSALNFSRNMLKGTLQEASVR